ncbi:YrbL family protein [Halomonas alkalicola]|uniref:YrbL family protein n=1 Tax=Halomonas alkalicola TaxID=1930622 RepID=UPI0035E561DC
MPEPSTLIRLADIEPLASGGSRLIYPHPERPGQLIKVVKHGSGRLKARFQVTRQLRELREYIRILENTDDKLIRHLPGITGLIATDLGAGLSVEAIQGADGRLAPTFSRLLGESHAKPHHRDLLATFFDRLLSSSAITGDLSRNNLVLGCDPNGNDYFALVDGLGDNTLVPMYAMVPGRNHNKKRRAASRFLADLDAALNRSRQPTAAAVAPTRK